MSTVPRLAAWLDSAVGIPDSVIGPDPTRLDLVVRFATRARAGTAEGRAGPPRPGSPRTRRRQPGSLRIGDGAHPLGDALAICDLGNDISGFGRVGAVLEELPVRRHT
jgi:hypothetical protein